MNCPSEETWSIYADDELARDEIRGVEMHLVSCRDCRTLVVALRDENTAFCDALNERETALIRSGPRSRPAPAQGFTFGLPAAVAGVTVVLGGIWRRAQTGNVQHYALSFLFGAVAIIAYYAVG